MSSHLDVSHNDDRMAKRPRLSSHDRADGRLNICRSTDFWLNDGNIILQIMDGTQFRVHKAVLAMDSVIFRDMFEVVVSASERLCDGCAVVEVQDEKEDLQVMLSALYMPALCVICTIIITFLLLTLICSICFRTACIQTCEIWPQKTSSYCCG
jgi:hypothetical protein